ncbi:MAG: hypothetical protein AB1560_10505, partial [Pseudomonadota bacterium]
MPLYVSFSAPVTPVPVILKYMVPALTVACTVCGAGVAPVSVPVKLSEPGDTEKDTVLFSPPPPPPPLQAVRA